MVGELLGLFQSSAVGQVVRDAGGPKSVAPDDGRNDGVLRPPANHVVDVAAGDPLREELFRLSLRHSKERSPLLRAKLRRVEIGVEILFQLVVHRHLVELSALLVQPDPPAFSLRVVIFDVHRHQRPDPGEGVDHEADDGAVA